MGVQANVTVKLTLDEAAVIRAALTRHVAGLIREAAEADDGTTAGKEQAEAARADAGRAETMLRRDF